MSVISCGAQSDDDVKVYEFSEEAKNYTGINEYDHLCAECLKDINEDKDLCVVKGVIKVKKIKRLSISRQRDKKWH